METNKKKILIEQCQKIQEVIETLTSNFNEEDLEDDLNFLTIVNANLRNWAEQA